MARTKKQIVNIEEMIKLVAVLPPMLNARPIIAFSMRQCGANYDEIGEVFGVTRQMAKTLVEQAERSVSDVE